MPLDLSEVNVLVAFVPSVLNAEVDFEAVVDSTLVGAWNAHTVTGTKYPVKVRAIVTAANGPANWIRDLLVRLQAHLPKRPGGWAQIERWLKLLDGGDESTAANPFDEVVLQGGKPFVNRKDLRARLQRLADPNGSRVLHVEGESKVGKSFSFELLHHAATRRGFEVNRFRIRELPTLHDVADEVLACVKDDSGSQPMVVEGPERLARKLASQVRSAIKAGQVPRFFVFDEFPESVPQETLSFITLLARYSEEDLRPYLRVVLVKFPGTLDSDVEAAALREVVQTFSDTDMLQLLMQVRDARKWTITEAVAKERIDAFLKEPRTLRERFGFLKDLIEELTKLGGTS